MKITNITPGLIPIPPPTWGAVEKIIWEIHNNLLILGHDSQIKYLDEVDGTEDIVHIHVANLANEAHKRRISYYFTMHDHHAFLYGKESYVYKENLEAIKNAKKAFVPAKYLVDYFEGIPEYFSHGVNTNYFTPTSMVDIFKIKLLCVANNGFIHDQTEDRKGFGYAIDAARKLNLPITIVGPSNNKKYFEKFPSNYDKLEIVYDASEEQLLKIYQQHHIFIHPSILEAGHPNLTILEAMACGLPVVGTFEENNSLDGMEIVDQNTDEIVESIQKIRSELADYSAKSINQARKLSWNNRTKELLKFYDMKNTMRDQLLHEYSNMKKLDIKPKLINKLVNNRKININFIKGPCVEVISNNKEEYYVEFIDTRTNKVLHSGKIENNHWIRASREWYTDWLLRVRLTSNNEQILEHKFNPMNKRVYIALTSKSLGDTLAWMPYVEEFRKKHDCEVICSTFWNHFFKSTYKDIILVEPGEEVHSLYSMYEIGIWGKEEQYKNPVDTRKIPLQQVASNVLGLEYREIKPLIHKKPKLQKIKGKYVCIAIHGSSQAKYWNNPTGWQEIVDHLNKEGYKVVIISKEESGYMGNNHPTGVIDKSGDRDIYDRINDLEHADASIGISSGLSWLSWAVGTPTIVISGHTEPWYEFKCERIINKDVCNGCWHEFKYNPGDWNWCPMYNDFECTKSITSAEVIKSLNKILKK